jgi:hypothetical protein
MIDYAALFHDALFRSVGTLKVGHHVACPRLTSDQSHELLRRNLKCSHIDVGCQCPEFRCCLNDFRS